VLPTSGYRMVASPTLYSGQELRARVEADPANGQPVATGLYVKVFGAADALEIVRGPVATVMPGTSAVLAWRVDVPTGGPIARVGIECTSPVRASGTVYLDRLTWEGTPTVRLGPPCHDGTRWLDAWVKAVSAVLAGTDHDLRLMQDEGTGLVLQGTREWTNYVASARLTPHLARSFGLVARAQGLRRYYALRLVAGQAQLIRELDGTVVLADCPYPWELYRGYDLELRVDGAAICGRIDGVEVLRATDDRLTSGAVGLLIEEGRLGVDGVQVRPAR